MAICNIMKELRENKKLSMSKIAEALEIPKGTYASYEYGQREPNIEMINKIANFYGVTTDYLLGRSDTQSDPFAAYDLDDEELRFFTGFLNKNHAVRKLVIQTFKPLFEQFKFTIKGSDGNEKEIQFKNLFDLK